MAAPNKLHFFIVDDDVKTAELYKILLEHAGHQVTLSSDSKIAAKQIAAIQPDCVLSDLSMPDVDGFDLYAELRKIENIKQPTFIIVSGKLYDYDRRRAFELGIDGYFSKPIDPETFVSDIIQMIKGQMVIQFWGVRGTLAVPGEKTNRYGGNTSCVTLNYAKKDFIIFDAGTGIKELSNFLMKQNQFPVYAKILISHPHYDHICGLPFFHPLYMQGNKFEIMGGAHNDLNMEQLIAGQMDTVYFPITIKEFAANLSFRNLKEETFNIADLQVSTLLLNHPGKCLGYRVQHRDKAFCYITDNELYAENSPNYIQFDVDRLVNFIQDADVVVMDATYSDEAYAQKVGWGHSGVSRVIDIADKAKVKLLCLFHHDIDETDNDIDIKVKTANELLNARNSSTKCIAPHEGDKIVI